MKSSRNYPVYTVNKHAEGLLVGGHPWVYENDILDVPRRRSPKTAPWPMWSAPKGAYLGTGLRFTEKQDPGAAHLPQRQRHL